MDFNRLIVAFVTLLGLAESGMHHASIKSKYGQLVTSNTLRWTQMSDSLNIHTVAVPSGTGNPNIYVCRAEHHGALLVGQTSDIGSHCVIGFVNRLYKKDKFELLINEDRSARLEWQPYNKYAGVPVGAVAGVDESSASVVGDNNIFIGRHLKPGSTSWLPGSIEIPRRSAEFGVMRVFDSHGQMSEEASGDILVEIEPILYELVIHNTLPDDEPRRTKKILRSDVVLAKSSLFRFDEGKDVEARMQKVLSYDYEKSEYYGQIPGMIRALSTTISLPNGQKQSVLWGLPEKSQQHETIMVGHALQHFRAVDVSVVGIRITEENPYKATLTSTFPDGSERSRTIEGVVQRIYLDNIRPEYSRVYHIKESVPSSNSINGISTTSKPSEAGGGRFQYHEQFRDNGVHRDAAGQKRQTKDRMWPLEGEEKKAGLDQQQLLMASNSSSAAAPTLAFFARPHQYCLFSLLLLVLLRKLS